MNNTLWGHPRYWLISVKKVWKNCCTPISLWSPINSGAKIFVLYTRFRICKNICTHPFGFGCYWLVCLKKVPKMYIFDLSPFWNLNFDKPKVNFFQNFWYFWSILWQTVSFLSLGDKTKTYLWVIIRPIFWHKDLSFIRVTKSKKGVSSPPSIFLMISN